ncbi:MAG: NAD-dependent epimerase/dehydratase family protein [Opitutia bacterium]
MRWLVTGASGFTGLHLASLIRSRGESLATPGVEGQGADAFDLTRPDLVEAFVDRFRPDIVVHLAAIASPTHPDPSAFTRVNVEGTGHLLAACARLPNPPRIVLASSATVYAPAPGMLDESSPIGPSNAYGASKWAMERHAGSYVGQLPLIIARPFNYTGPGQDVRFVVPKIIAAFRRRDPVLTLGALDVARDFSDVRDVAVDYLRLSLSAPAGTVVNLCSGRPRTIRSIVETCAHLCGWNAEIRVDPALVRPDEIPCVAGNPALLRRLTGRGHDIDLDTTLADMLAR